MLAKEALDVLALKRGATSAEIREAYRDLVKVWHPDRFGSDARLRQKAEEKLQQINEAYRVLQSGSGMDEADTGRTASSARDNSPSSPHSQGTSIRRGGRAESSGNGVVGGWIFGFAGVLLIVWAGYIARERGLMQSARPAPVAVQKIVGSGPQQVPQIPVGPRPELVPAENSSGSSDSRLETVQVRTLSEAETEQLESACSKEKQWKDSSEYQACLKAQLDMITDAPGRPDLSGLSGVERESMESVCSEARRVHGVVGYDRCVTVQVAALAAEPARPDMAALDAADRDSIETACRSAKDRDGPSAYNRCRVRFVKALAESK